MRFTKAAALVTSALSLQAVGVQSAAAQGPVSLQAAVRGMLANNCSTLLGADLRSTTNPINTTDISFRAFVPGSQFDNTNPDRRPATARNPDDEIKGLVKQTNPDPTQFPFDTYAAYNDEGPGALDFDTVYLRAVATSAETNGSLVPPRGAQSTYSTLVNGNPVLVTDPPQNFPGTTDPRFDILFPLRPGTTDERQTFFDILRQTETTTGSETEYFARPGALGSELDEICRNSESNTTSVTVVDIFNVSFNATGTTDGSTPNGQLPPGTSPLSLGGSLGGSGVAASRTQDGVARREGGLRALIERLRRRARQQRVVLASLDESAAGYAPRERSYTLVIDVAGGVASLDRKETNLEGAFEADSILAVGGAALVFDSGLIIGASVNYDNTESDQVAGASNSERSFETETITGGLFAGWTNPAVGYGFDEPGSFNMTLGVQYGTGDQSYTRNFSITKTPLINGEPDPNPAHTARFDAQLAGAVDRSVSSATLQISASQSFGQLAVSPHAAVSFVETETEGYDEQTSGAEEGLGLRYAKVEDEWLEVRVGGQVSATFLGENSATILSLGGDAVFVGDAETPARTAFFLQDLRANPTPIVYNVDNLDDQFYDVSAGISMQFDNGVQPFASAFTRLGHDYLDVTGALVGLRFVY